VGLLSLQAAVLKAQGSLHLAQRFPALRKRLPLPEHYESKAANAATRLGVSMRTLAKHLHPDPPGPGKFTSYECHISPILQTHAIPHIGGNPVFSITYKSHFCGMVDLMPIPLWFQARADARLHTLSPSILRALAVFLSPTDMTESQPP
jgi:hypothetical protein